MLDVQIQVLGNPEADFDALRIHQDLRVSIPTYLINLTNSAGCNWL